MSGGLIGIERSPVPRSPVADAARAPQGAAASARARWNTVFSTGFRPFFLLAAAVAASAIGVWIAVLHGVVAVRGTFGAVDLHAHEMLFGFIGAVIAGFLLTAVRNWTGTAPASPKQLAALAALYVAGRAAVVIEAAGGPRGVAWIEALFLPALAVAIAVPIVRTRNRRNFGVVAVVAALAAADIAAHAAAWTASAPAAAASRAAALMLPCVLLAIVGGRVIPLFTRNVVSDAGASVRAPGVVDALAVGGAALSAVAVVVAAAMHAAPLSMPLAPAVLLAGSWGAAAILVATGAATLARMRGWASTATRAHPLLWILHAGHAALGVGFVARGVAFVAPAAVPPSVGVHLLAIGALAVLSLGMMSRVALGHSGRALVVSPTTVAAYGCLLAALPARVAAAWWPALLDVAGVAFAAAFCLFLAAYARVLVSPRADGKPG